MCEGGRIYKGPLLKWVSLETAIIQQALGRRSCQLHNMPKVNINANQRHTLMQGHHCSTTHTQKHTHTQTHRHTRPPTHTPTRMPHYSLPIRHHTHTHTHTHIHIHT